MALPLDNPQMARGEIDIREPEVYEFGVPQPRHEEQFEHDHMGNEHHADEQCSPSTVLRHGASPPLGVLFDSASCPTSA